MTQASVQTATTEDTRRIGAFAVLRRPSFRWLLLGTTLSNSAQWIQQVTLSWLVYDLTASGAMLGTLNLVRSVATLGLAPVAGVAIDRLSRRTLMFVANSWLFAISLRSGWRCWPATALSGRSSFSPSSAVWRRRSTCPCARRSSSSSSRGARPPAPSRSCRPVGR